jgi:hypothetical protein
MKIFGSWSVISFLRLTAQFIWAVLLATLIIQGLMLGLMLYSGGVLGSSFPVHINYSGLWTTFIELTESDSVVLSAKSLPMDYAPIGAGIPLMLSLGLFQLGLSCLALYGFSILKRVLDAMYRSDSFTVQNGSDIRIIGILLLIARRQFVFCMNGQPVSLLTPMLPRRQLPQSFCHRSILRFCLPD